MTPLKKNEPLSVGGGSGLVYFNSLDSGIFFLKAAVTDSDHAVVLLLHFTSCSF